MRPSMRALVYDRYGSPDALRLEQVPRPQPGPGEVLVRVHAASVNSWDWDLVVGKPLVRLSAPFRPQHRILGADIAGTVEAVGEGAAGFAPGDMVFGDLSEGAWGGFADYAVARAADLATIPQGLGFIEAASIPQAGALALQALRLRPTLAACERVLFNGAGGGVGTFAIQLLKSAGAKVTAVDRGEKREALLALGADAFIDYGEADFAKGSERYDFIIDVVASRSVRDHARVLSDGGSLVVVGGTIGSIAQTAAFGQFVGRRRGLRQQLLIYRVSASDNLELGRRCKAGALRPVIDSTFPLERGAEALQRLGSGLAVGKVVVTMEGHR